MIKNVVEIMLYIALLIAVSFLTLFMVILICALFKTYIVENVSKDKIIKEECLK